MSTVLLKCRFHDISEIFLLKFVQTQFKLISFNVVCSVVPVQLFRCLYAVSIEMLFMNFDLSSLKKCLQLIKNTSKPSSRSLMGCSGVV